MLRLDAMSSRELKAVILAIRQSDKVIQKQIRQQTKETVTPVWMQAMAQGASTPLEARVLGSTARVAVSNQNVRLSSAALAKRLSGGLSPAEHFGPVEFGSHQMATSTYTARSKRGKSFQVTRHTQRQFRPYNRKGYVFYPAVSRVVPRIAALWTQTVVRTFHDAFEGKTSG